MTEQEQQQQQEEKEEKEEKEEDQKEEKDDQKTKEKNERTPRTSRCSSSQVRNPRFNKLYRAPPTPTKDALIDREKSFVLDSVAVSSISLDYSRANPKLGSALPTYNSQMDRHVRGYFSYRGVDKTLEKNLQRGSLSCSIEGLVHDRFKQDGSGFRYLSRRAPCGYSNESRMGHWKLWVHPNPTVAEFERKPRELEGFNGRFGYRRTTPSLRKFPSPFGVNTSSTIY